MTIMDLIKTNFFVYFVCLLSLLACVYTIYSVSSYQTAINQAWQDQWDDSGCFINPQPINITYNLWGDYDADKNIDQDP